MMSKKGSTLTNWIFTIMIILVFVVILQTQVLSPMNSTYGNNLTSGLDTSGLDDFASLKSTSHVTIEGAEASQTSEGLTLKDSWTVGKGAYSTLVSFIDGTFINSLVAMMDAPPMLGKILTVMIWISLIMIIIYIFMKVVP
jgi:hypothetical protein